MADALNSLIKSLGKDAKKDYGLPGWIRVGAKLQYKSQSSGKTMPVTVEKVCNDKQAVELTFPHGRHAVPFSKILGLSNPLSQPPLSESTADTPAAGEAEGVDADKFFANLDKAWANPSKREKAGPGPMQGPMVKPTWARKMENDRVEDVDSSPERKGPEAIDSSPEADRKQPDEEPDPYGLGEKAAASKPQKSEASRKAKAKDAEKEERKKSSSAKESEKKQRSQSRKKDRSGKAAVEAPKKKRSRSRSRSRSRKESSTKAKAAKKQKEAAKRSRSRSRSRSDASGRAAARKTEKRRRSRSASRDRSRGRGSGGDGKCKKSRRLV